MACCNNKKEQPTAHIILTKPAPEDEEKICFKVVVIGECEIGKSSLTNTVVKGKYTPVMETTVGVSMHLYKMRSNDREVNLQFWDTAGQERFAQIVRAYYLGTHIVVICFDLSNEQHAKTKFFDPIDKAYLEVSRFISHKPYFIFVATKADRDTEKLFDTYSEAIKEHIKEIHPDQPFSLCKTSSLKMELEGFVKGLDAALEYCFVQRRKRKMDEQAKTDQFARRVDK